uniref:Uncharacterized protein n=1 Tax=Acrobeloides nanus TaxID=290746 RepID=A0A914E0D8_9BILA
MNEALRGNIPSELDLTCPAKTIRPMRFKITRKIEHKVIEKQVPIDIENYIDALKDMDIDGKKRKYLLNYLENHHIEKLMSPNKLEVKPEGFDYEDYEEDFTAAEVSKHDGTWEKIKMIKDCLIYEVHEEIRGEIFIYILSEGYWVRLKNDFIKRMDEVVEEAKKIWNDTKLFLPPYNHKDEVDYIKHVEQQQHESPGWSGITSTSRTGKEPELLHPEPGTSHNGNSLITERNL